MHGLRQVARLAGKSLNSKYLQKRARIVVVFPQHVHNIKWRMLQQCNTRWRVGGREARRLLYSAKYFMLLRQAVCCREVWNYGGLATALAGRVRSVWDDGAGEGQTFGGQWVSRYSGITIAMERILDHGWPDPPRAHAA